MKHAEFGSGELPRLAASLDRLSAHVLGEALAAADAGLQLTMPLEIREEPGQGIQGTVDGHHFAVGIRAFMRSVGIRDAEQASTTVATTRGSGEAHVVVDGSVAGVMVMADELRPDADRIVDRLRAEGIRHVAMISGDRRSVAERVGREVGVDRVYAEQSPEDKLEVVRRIGVDPGAGRVTVAAGRGVCRGVPGSIR